MPTDISNLVTYVNSMSVTLYDKCWWIDKIPDEIDTVIDFGCAGGDLAHMINRIMPGRFTYIGVDNSPIMLDLAKHNFALFQNFPVAFYPNLSEALKVVVPEHTVLVMNSVIHEIYSYLSNEERADLGNIINNSNIKYIAVRDMYPGKDILYHAAWQEKFSEHPVYGDKWREFCNVANASHNATLEFLLKYRYDANWNRECYERYLWHWGGMFPNYNVEFENHFYIPYIRKQAYADFGMDMGNQTTHKKMLFVRP